MYILFTPKNYISNIFYILVYYQIVTKLLVVI